jgi:predicted HD phosphohydrolase
VNPDEIDEALVAAFAASRGEREVVVRAAMDLYDSGRYAADQGHSLTAREVVEHLHDAPGGRLSERWNWWVGALELAYGDYGRFRVERWTE